MFKRNYIKLICYNLILLLILTSRSIYVYGNSLDTPFDTNKYIVIDTSDEISALPKNFRIIPELNISGSAQFSPSQLPNIIKKINNPDIFIADLRQESHGFINDIPISFYSLYELLNNGFTSAQSLKQDLADLNKIKIDDEITLYERSSLPKEKVLPKTVANEGHLVRKNNIHYIRFAVRDGGIPSPEVVDNFVIFTKKLSKDSHVHFHCLHGEGRTTTFMVLYEIMNNNSNKTLDEILTEQLNAGGIILTTDLARKSFLCNFYEYTSINKENNYSISYSNWLKTFR